MLCNLRKTQSPSSENLQSACVQYVSPKLKQLGDDNDPLLQK